tara:strand:- start:1028 stop:1750 length:723 start_codon:yes stop_codon:yes gene_type:complete
VPDKGKKNGLALVISVGNKPPKAPEDTSTPDKMKKYDRMEKAWSFLKAPIPEATNAHGLGPTINPETGVPDYDERQDSRKLPPTMNIDSRKLNNRDYMTTKPYSMDGKNGINNNIDIDDKLDLLEDFDNQLDNGTMDDDSDHKFLDEEEYQKYIQEVLMGGTISGRNDMTHDPEQLEDYDTRHGRAEQKERASKLAEGMELPNFNPTEVESANDGTMAPRNKQRLLDGRRPTPISFDQEF